MANEYISVRNLKFLLHECLNAPARLSQSAYYADYNAETLDMITDAAKQIGDTVLHPYFTEMDRSHPELHEGEVKVHPQLKVAIQTFAESGWIGANATYEEGGMQMPRVMHAIGSLIFYAANVSGSTYVFLTQGAANLIRCFGNQQLKSAYIPKMYSGEWQGTMALTEPQAGSSLGDITSAAEPTDDGYYKIKGQKIYISGGDHDAVDNVVHLMLARIKGAPAGIKGISLFVVPKKRLENGTLVANDVTTAGLFEKMGCGSYVAAHLMMGEQDDCRGWLVGEPNKGLSYMFQMMNEARLGTGFVAAGNASAAYYASLQYARERSQGRHPSNKDASLPPVLIIEHADVKRMLLFQKSVVEGSIALLLMCSYFADLELVAEGQEKARAQLLLELLTPIAKTYPSEMGIQSISAGLQCLGGAGYCKDFPLEQLYREVRINAIYEGTTGIQAMDLLGRKVMMENGAAAKAFFKEVAEDIKRQSDPRVLPYAKMLAESLGQLQQVTMHLAGLGMKQTPEIFLADATLYLEYFGTVVIAWMWLLQGEKAAAALSQASGSEVAFYESKLATMKYFMEYELPKTLGLHKRLINDDKFTADLPSDFIV
jgi:alkylation response protein AidB-like acyl-CoA dehydrogenase